MPRVEFSQDIFDKVCERIAAGESLRKICKSEDMPGTTAVLGWVGKDENLAKQYARAREQQADTIFDECLAIADQYENPDDDPDHIQRAKLRIDTRKWMAGKMRPKKYGEKLDLSSSDGTMSPNKKLTPDEAQAELERLGIAFTGDTGSSASD